ncbi:FIST signal transduction protein [Zavarzinella formosa]|uniref:FIST signal transduction protein n=1 Tax=Zavarzinella formosa TaxID=360055 RepID=UPI0002FC52BC|nr:FIST N-terminal domain-containing protein [Zavarzinella formosa]
MPFANALSELEDTAEAASEVALTALEQLGVEPELAVVFFSPHHASENDQLMRTLRQQLPDVPLVGMLGESVVGGAREAEEGPALSLWLGSWNGKMDIDVFHLSPEATPDGPTLFGWPDSIFEADPAQSVLLTFADPFSFPAVELFLPTINEQHPGLRVIGGMSSNPFGPEVTSLFLDGEARVGGAIGVLLRGTPRVRTLVSQGCRPVGKPLVVTKATDNVIQELSGPATPLNYLRLLLEEVSQAERELMQRGLLIGLAVSEYRDQFRRGDFLIRNLIGLDPRTGALAVTDRVRLGQTVQFQTRDAAAAHEDLAELLTHVGDDGFKPTGGLLFTCNGRGKRMFTTPNHDAETIREALGNVALAGLFAAGELGPVGDRNFIHGFTASAVFFE